MRLLIVTQAVDIENPVLGFFHEWVREFSKNFEQVSVICLFEGKHDLPPNVEVYSLGKEKKEAYKAQYTERFLALAWGLRHEYDAVFVHMNQEYVLIAGWLWMLLRKRVYLWRNHYDGSRLTDLAVSFCAKVFCTSKHSYTAKFPKTVIMPIGVDTDTFVIPEKPRKESLISVGRIAPSKRLEVIIDAIALVVGKGLQLRAHFYGDALPEDMQYAVDLHRRADEKKVAHLVEFHPAVPNFKTPELYGSHDIFVNCSGSGMYDKTIFEALACGALVLASSKDYAQIIDPRLSFDGSAEDLAAKLRAILKLPTPEKELMQKQGRAIAEENSLHTLARKLSEEMTI